jgi:LacI family transcriptional regulator
MAKVNMNDIAKALGISVVSVSKALSNKDGVSKELREKVKEKAEELGYRPKAQNAEAIGILIAEHFVSDYASFYWSLASEILKASASRGMYAEIQAVSRQDEQEGNIPPFADDLRTGGIIVLGAISSSYIDILSRITGALVLVDAGDSRMPCTTINTDNYNDFYHLTSSLLEEGYKRFAFVGNVRLNTTLQDRYLGFCKALLTHGISADEACIIDDRDDYEFRTEFVLPEQLPEVMVCNCDQSARNLIAYLWREGIRVPEDVSVTGYYDYIFATIAEPQLTTVHVDFPQFAEAAVNAVLEMAGDGIARHYTFPGHMVRRNSTK